MTASLLQSKTRDLGRRQIVFNLQMPFHVGGTTTVSRQLVNKQMHLEFVVASLPGRTYAIVSSRCP